MQRFTLAMIALAALLGAPGTATAAQPVCTDAATLVSARARIVWRHGAENLDIATLFARGGSSPVSVAAVWFTSEAGDRTAISKSWSARAHGIALSDDSLDALAQLGPDHIAFYRLAAGRVIAANAIGGTAACNASLVMRVENGRARLIENPPDWTNDPFRFCGVQRSFATLRHLSVVLDSGPTSSTPNDIVVRINLLAASGWMKPCSVDMAFDQGIDQRPPVNDWARLNDWPKNDCDASTCDRLRKAIVPLVGLARRAPDRAPGEALQALSPGDRERYGRDLKVIDPRDLPGLQRQLDGEAVASDHELTDTAPLLLPLALDGRLYAVSLGHLTIGWRVFPDWMAKVSAISGARVQDIARFAIPTGSAGLRSVTVHGPDAP